MRNARTAGKYSAVFGTLLFAVACNAHADDSARSQLAVVLNDSLGAAVQANASYLRDSSHLQIAVSPVTFAGMTDAARATKAREISQLALRHYTHAADVDSVSIVVRELYSRGVAKILWSRTFAVPELAHTSSVSVRLIAPDSATDESGDEHKWYRVLIMTQGKPDTLAGVMAQSEPVIANDGTVTGLSFDSSGMIRSGYVYTPATRALTIVSLPLDISAYFSEASISATGNLLAYIAQDAKANFSAVLRSWPSLALLARADAGSGFPSDVDFNHLEWDAAGFAETWVRVKEGSWVHVVLSEKGVLRQDTTKVEPTAQLTP